MTVNRYYRTVSLRLLVVLRAAGRLHHLVALRLVVLLFLTIFNFIDFDLIINSLKNRVIAVSIAGWVNSLQ